MNSKILTFTLFSLAFLLYGRQSLASGSYSEEGIAFYAQTNPSGYAIEGIAFYANATPATGTVSVYRFANATTGDHFYTASEDEKNSIVNNPQWGYVSEGTAFYASITSSPGTTIPVYRFANALRGDHFYTSSEDEKTAILNNPQWGYVPEGISFYVYSSQSTTILPVYRFINTYNGNHFYTASTEEKDSISISPVYRFSSTTVGHHFYTASENEKSIVANTSRSGYATEGVAFYEQTTQTPGTLPVYRFSNYKSGDYFYTTSEDEKTSIINNPQGGYAYEGIAFYAPATQLPGYYPVYRFANSTTNDHFYTASESERYYLLIPPLGPEISVGLWSYSKADIMNSPFQIDANKSYNIKDANGTILAQVSGNSTTSVSYNDNQNQLTVTQGVLSNVLAGTGVTFDAVDGDNSTLIFNTHRSNYVSNDWRGKIDQYRGKIKVQYYRGADIINNSTTTVTQIWIDNILPLEQYTWGSAETSGTGNINHTEVMTTIYRTYGFWYIKYANKYSALGFKIRSDSGSQNYGGYNWETAHPNVKTATQNTRGVIASYGGDVALTPYSSWSDGRTRSWQEKWGGTDYPWCQSVPDPYGVNVSQSSGSHMVGLIANGSVNLAANYGWSWDRILHYYFTNIYLPTNY